MPVVILICITTGVNLLDDFKINVNLTPAARSQDGLQPGQVIVYHAWEPYQFANWKSYDAAIPGMMKWLDLAADYGHLNYYRWNWCNQPLSKWKNHKHGRTQK